MPQRPRSAAYLRREYQRQLKNSPDDRLRAIARLRRLLGYVCIVAVILFGAANYRLLTRDSLKQMGEFITGGLQKAEEGNHIVFETGTTAVVAALDDTLAVADHDRLSIQKPGGAQLTEPLGFSAPVLTANERYVLAYDRGGVNAVLASRIAVASKQTAEAPILFGCVSENGDYALVTSESGYKAAVYVYTSGGRQRFKWATPDYYFSSAALSADGKRLALTAFKQEGTQFESTLILRNLDSEDITEQVSLGTVVPIAAGFLTDDSICVIGDHATFIISRKGKIIHERSYATGDLNAYAFGKGAVVLAQRLYASAARIGLLTIDANGKASAMHAVTQDLQAIDYDGSRLALLTAAGLTVFDGSLRPLWENDSAAGARDVRLVPDGTVWAVYPKQAERLSAASDTTAEVKK